MEIGCSKLSVSIVRPYYYIHSMWLCAFVCVGLSVLTAVQKHWFCLVWFCFGCWFIWRLDVCRLCICTLFKIICAYVHAYVLACLAACVLFMCLAHLTTDKHWRIFLSDAYVNFGIHLTPKLCTSIKCHIQCRCVGCHGFTFVALPKKKVNQFLLNFYTNICI